MFGVIGGYQEGGDSPLVSYSSYFTSPARILFGQAEKGSGSHPVAIAQPVTHAYRDADHPGGFAGRQARPGRPTGP